MRYTQCVKTHQSQAVLRESDSVNFVSSEPEAASESAPVAPPEADEVILTNLSLLFLSRFLPADDTLVVYLLLFR